MASASAGGHPSPGRTVARRWFSTRACFAFRYSCSSSDKATSRGGGLSARRPPRPGWPRAATSVVLGLFAAPPRFGLGFERGGVLERAGERLAVGVLPREQQDPLLRESQLAVTALKQAHALLVAGQGLLQAGLAVLQLAEDALQLGQSLFKGQLVVRRGIVHERIHR